MSAYGYSLYDTGYYWNGKFGPTTTQNYYGLTLYSQLDVSPFTATPRDYETIMLGWQQPQGTIYGFRLLSNRYGFPVDQNDGNVLISSSTFPGTAYADQYVIPGTYHYYGIYLQITNTEPYLWQRAAFASCLAPDKEGMGGRMFDLLPTYYREYLNGELTQDAAGNSYLQQFLNVIGWGMDYLKTQYDVLFNHLNDPMAIPLGDLVNLAGELGMPFQPEVPAGLMRKALANWTHVCQERGTPAGLSENITLLTGYPVDLQSGRNQMLEHDQATPADPIAQVWNSSIGYAIGEMVQYTTYVYKCIASGSLGNAPTGAASSNTWWQVQQNVTDPYATLANPNTVGGINTWQALYPALDSGGTYTTPAGTLVNTIGMVSPITSTDHKHGAFSVFNKAGSTQDIMLRSVSQITSDRTGSNAFMTPDQLQAVKDGIPIPRLNIVTNGWLPSVRYPTNSIVLYDGVVYAAQRASTNALPPSPGTPLNANPYFAANISPWTALYSGTTLSQSGTQAYQGTESLKIVPNGTSASQGAQAEKISVIPGATYTVQAWGWLTASSSNVYVGINWYDPFGAYISSSSTGTVSAPAATWTNFTSTSTAPGNAVTGQMYIDILGTPPSSQISYWDSAVVSCSQTPEWAVLSTDNRLRMMMSGYADGPSGTVQVIPFIEWYDESGNLISSNGQARVFARTASAGVAGIAPNLTFDGFALGAGTYLNGRQTDTQDQLWVTQTGLWQVSGFNGGSTYPAAAGTRSVATVTGQAGTTGTPVWLGVTFASPVPTGTDSGIVFRMASLTSYWRAGMTGLYTVTGGTASLIGTYSTACQPGDRLVVNLSGNNITVYRNGTQVLTTTNAYNATATEHGIAVEGTTV